jgi:transposase-like protein
MTIAIVRDPIYRGRRFQSEIIELCVCWYLTYRLSYRDLVEMLAERGVIVSHTTIYRWGQQYVPEFERRWSRYAKPVHPSWRVDETAISVRGGQRYLYRAVDKFGKTVDSLLCADRSISAARAFFWHPTSYLTQRRGLPPLNRGCMNVVIGKLLSDVL